MRICRKLSEQKGTTLGEMLVSVLILLFLTMVVAGGTGVAVKVYRTERDYSDSRILANSILLAMTEELRYGSDMEAGEDGMSVSYNSRVYGAGVTMELEQELTGKGGMVKLTYNGEGQDMDGDKGDNLYLYHENIYSGYRVCRQGDQPVFALDDESILITYDICDAYGNVKASLDGVRIRLLNQEEESGL